MTQDTLSPQLARQHEALVRELDHIRGQLPDNAEDMSEAFERYARTLAVLVRALESALRIENRALNKEDKESNKQSHGDIITEIEHRLARIARANTAKSVSDSTERKGD
jgi:hypothetical protein